MTKQVDFYPSEAMICSPHIF